MSGLALLRVPFPANQINQLPKQMRKDDNDKGKCERGSRYSADSKYCGGWHARSLHLDFVGHAALTDRFLDVDPEWSWEPVAFGVDGLPKFDGFGGLWIRLTLCGVTRLGYGDAQGKSGPNAVKEAIGDGLRNAGMRFGAALDLWHKGELHGEGWEPPPVESAGLHPVDGVVPSTGEILPAVAESTDPNHPPVDLTAPEHHDALVHAIDRTERTLDRTSGHDQDTRWLTPRTPEQEAEMDGWIANWQEGLAQSGTQVQVAAQQARVAAALKAGFLDKPVSDELTTQATAKAHELRAARQAS